MNDHDKMILNDVISIFQRKRSPSIHVVDNHSHHIQAQEQNEPMDEDEE
jgi:hypothetical protein